MKQVNRVIRLLLPLMGLVCILAPMQVAGVLPYLLGGVMLLNGLVQGARHLRSRCFLQPGAQQLGQDLVLVVVGAATLCAGDGAVTMMGITWGMLGLRKAAATANEALANLCQRRPAVLLVLETAIRLVLAMALLFEPFESFSSHLVLLGLELILANIRLLKEPETAED